MTLCSTSLQVLVPQGEMLLLGDTIIIPWNWKLILPLSHFELLMLLGQQGKKSFTGLTGVIDPDYQREIEEFSGGPVVKTRRFHCGGPCSIPAGNWDAASCTVQTKTAATTTKQTKKQREMGLLLHNTDMSGIQEIPQGVS